MLGGVGNMSCKFKVLELYLMDAYLSRFNLTNCELHTGGCPPKL
jgi:hypothetical protein